MTEWLVINGQMGDIDALQQLLQMWYPKLIRYAKHQISRLWFFMELNRLSVIREVKRVELQVSLLAEQVEHKFGS